MLLVLIAFWIPQRQAARMRLGSVLKQNGPLGRRGGESRNKSFEHLVGEVKDQVKDHIQDEIQNHILHHGRHHGNHIQDELHRNMMDHMMHHGHSVGQGAGHGMAHVGAHVAGHGGTHALIAGVAHSVGHAIVPIVGGFLLHGMVAGAHAMFKPELDYVVQQMVHFMFPEAARAREKSQASEREAAHQAARQAATEEEAVRLQQQQAIMELQEQNMVRTRARQRAFRYAENRYLASIKELQDFRITKVHRLAMRVWYQVPMSLPENHDVWMLWVEYMSSEERNEVESLVMILLPIGPALFYVSQINSDCLQSRLRASEMELITMQCEPFTVSNDRKDSLRHVVTHPRRLGMKLGVLADTDYQVISGVGAHEWFVNGIWKEEPRRMPGHERINVSLDFVNRILQVMYEPSKRKSRADAIARANAVARARAAQAEALEKENERRRQMAIIKEQHGGVMPGFAGALANHMMKVGN